MEVAYHPLVRRDIEEPLSYYLKISARLADEFQAELRSTINQAAENPLRFHPADQGFRRANLKRFPYHVLYEIRPGCACEVRLTILRHKQGKPRPPILGQLSSERVRPLRGMVKVTGRRWSGFLQIRFRGALAYERTAARCMLANRTRATAAWS